MVKFKDHSISLSIVGYGVNGLDTDMIWAILYLYLLFILIYTYSDMLHIVNLTFIFTKKTYMSMILISWKLYFMIMSTNAIWILVNMNAIWDKVKHKGFFI